MKKLVLLVCAMAASIAYAQVPQFTKIFNNDSTDNAHAIQQNSAGDYFILTSTNSFGQNKEDIQVTKTNGLGEVTWSYTYGTSSSEIGTDMLLSLDGGIVVVGYRESSIAGHDDAFIMKLNGSGVVQWTKDIRLDSTDRAYAVMQTNNGDLYTTGYIELDSLNKNAFLAKFNSSGTLSFIKTYGGAGNEIGYDLAETGGYIAIVGSTDYDSVNIGTTGDVDAYVAMVNTVGTLKGTRNFGSPLNDVATNVIAANNGFVVAGNTQGGHAPNDAFVVTMDTLRNVSTPFSIGGFGNDEVMDLHYSITGDLTMAVRATGYVTVQDIALYQLDLANSTISMSLISGVNSDGNSDGALAYTAKTGYTLLASGKSFSTDNTENIYLIKTDDNFANSCVGQVEPAIANGWVIQTNSHNYISTSGISSSVSFTRSSVTNSDSTICCTLTPRIANDTVVICSGESASLGKGSISGYGYSWTSIGGSYTSSAANPSVSPSSSTTYKLVVSSTDGECASDSATVHVVVNARQSIAALNDTFFCENDSVILQAAPNMTSYTWTGSTLLKNTQSVKLKVGDTLSLFMLDANACVYRDTVEVVEKELPLFTLGSDTTICDNLSITFVGPAGMANYNWNGTDTATSTYTTNESRIHTLVVTDAFGCEATDMVQLLTNPSSSFDLGPDTTLCENTSFTIVGPNALSGFIWNDTASTSSSITVYEGGTYWLEAYNSFDCPAYDTIVISEWPAPEFSLGSDTGYCDEVNAFLEGPANMEDYLWHNGSDMQNLTATGPGLYYLTVTDANGCEFTDSIDIEQYTSPSISLGPDTAVVEGKSIVLSPGSGYVKYVWSTGDETESLTITAAGEYSVTVTDENGCSDSDTVDVRSKPNSVRYINGVRYSAYPNPAANVLYLQSDGGSLNGQLNIVDQNGRTVISREVRGNRIALDVSTLSTGIYRLMLLTDNKMIDLTVMISQQ